MECGLYVVATPIGNLGDLSPRAQLVLESADLIAAEDTRHSRRLLQHFAIDTPLCAYHEHSQQRDQRRVLACLQEGGAVALVSDAGTPLISDPGYRLVRQVQAMGLPVRPLPGPCAAVAALSASGLPTDRFRFEGFLPSRAAAREERLRALQQEAATLVFYEAPHRVLDCLRSMALCLGGEREAVLARELSKTFETVRRASLASLAAQVEADPDQQRGEIVLLVEGHRGGGPEIDAASERLLVRLAQELPAKRAAAVVAEHTGLRKNALYQRLLDLKPS